MGVHERFWSVSLDAIQPQNLFSWFGWEDVGLYFRKRCHIFMLMLDDGALTLLVGRQEGHPACKKTEWWGDGIVISMERDADLRPSWCHCHSLSLASVKSRLVLPFWYWLTRIVISCNMWSKTQHKMHSLFLKLVIINVSQLIVSHNAMRIRRYCVTYR